MRLRRRLFSVLLEVDFLLRLDIKKTKGCFFDLVVLFRRCFFATPNLDDLELLWGERREEEKNDFSVVKKIIRLCVFLFWEFVRPLFDGQ